MKKTLFLSAILATALCSSAFAVTETITSTTNNQVNLQNYGAGDTITMEVTAGYLMDPKDNGTVTYAADLIVNHMTFSDGFSRENSLYKFTGTITGSGEISNTVSKLNGQNWEFSGNMSQYTGTLTMGCSTTSDVRVSRIILNGNSVGAATIKTTNNAVFATEGTVTLAGTTVTAAKTDIRANSTLNLTNGTTATLSNLSIGDGATIVVDAQSTLNVGNTITSLSAAGNGKVNVNSDTMTFTGAGETPFAGTLSVVAAASTSHGKTVTLNNFSGTVELTGRYGSAACNFGDATKIVLHGDRDNDSSNLNQNNTTGFWSQSAQTFSQLIEVKGEHWVDIFASAAFTFNGAVSGEMLRTTNGSDVTFNNTVTLDQFTANNNNVAFNGDTTIGTLNIAAADKTVTLATGKTHSIGSITGNGTLTNNGSLTVTGTISGGTINGNGANTVIRDTDITGGTFQNVTFDNTTVNGTITLNNYTGDGKLQNALSGLTKSDAQGASSTINLGGGEYTFNAETTVNAHHLVFGGATEINGHGYDGDGHTITLDNGASISTGTAELKIESEATLKITNGSVTSGSIVLGHDTLTNPGFLSMTGGSITTGFIKNNAGYAVSDNTFTMTGGTLTFTQGETGALSGVAATITGGTLSTAQAAWKIDSSDVSLGRVTISGANEATLTNVNLTGRTTLHTNVTVADSIGTVTSGGDAYAFLVENSSMLTFTGAAGTSFDLSNAGAGIGLQTGSSVVVDQNVSLTLKTFVYASGDNWATSNGSATVKEGATLTIKGQGYREAFLSSMNLQGSLDLAAGANLHLSTITGSETASLIVNGTMEVVNAGDTTVGSLTLGTGASLTLGTIASHDVDLSTTTLTVDGDSTLNANLVVNSGTLTFAQGAVLTMGCEVTISGSTVYVTIESTFDDFMAGLRAGNALVVIDGLESKDEVKALTLSGLYITDSTGNTFTNDELGLMVVENTYTSNGAYAIVVAPEPATATLSLLALAALASRRRRH